MDTARHFCRNQRAYVLVENHTLAFGVLRSTAAITHGDILQFTLTTLITYRAIQRVIDQQKFHGAFLSVTRQLGGGMHNHVWHDWGRTSWQRFWRLLHFHQAHATVSRH